eukprot:GHRR01019130.1.p1 GENE.GHRR01019130.1~~GHRR01019130.1.p1  ORF type:complete len:133 (+),score=14.49 GHRR01019130.1:202-600(+)
MQTEMAILSRLQQLLLLAPAHQHNLIRCLWRTAITESPSHAKPSRCFTRLSNESWLGSYGLSLLGISRIAGIGCKARNTQSAVVQVLHESCQATGCCSLAVTTVTTVWSGAVCDVWEVISCNQHAGKHQDAG